MNRMVGYTQYRVCPYIGPDCYKIRPDTGSKNQNILISGLFGQISGFGKNPDGLEVMY